MATALAEDVGAGDLTVAAVVPADARGRAVITQKEPGVISGLDVAGEVFGQVDDGLAFEPWRPRASGERGERWPRSRVRPARS